MAPVTQPRNTFWSALLMAHFDGKYWPEAIAWSV